MEAIATSGEGAIGLAPANVDVAQIHSIVRASFPSAINSDVAGTTCPVTIYLQFYLRIQIAIITEIGNPYAQPLLVIDGSVYAAA